ncbi:hypothetical protein IEO21_09498 [Rhodonia placenta]|uniref:DNA2/NAM7 helicase-like C-terminal domain-containing protein n=1 Tax=Rhodonia placenta TaxID=104341 RepID=A0A8H7NUA1_9APHY|nr:hypothetical protein IEO21_09498 [Postia placenta]
MHLFHKFKELQKICFFGDPEQLPPYGKETAPGIQTIFDIEHLNAAAFFLNTQYRMPQPVGQFISQHIYRSRLRSKHDIEDMSCVQFVDVFKGEETKVGSSWMNMEEVHAVVNLVRYYYKSKDFCIITPYDPQRGAIQRSLKAAGLPWDMVYNVDSFQGTYTISRETRYSP